MKNSALRYLLAVLCVLVFGGNASANYFVYTEPLKHLQVVGVDKEIWMFLEFRRVACAESIWGFLFRDTPRCRTVQTIQKILLVNQRGTVLLFDNYDGVSFAPSISTIFGMKGEVFLYQSENASAFKSTYVWKEGVFQIVDLDAEEKMFDGRLSEKHIWELEAKGYWKRLATGLNGKSKAEFDWSGLSVAIEINEGHDRTVLYVNAGRSGQEPEKSVEITVPKGEKVLEGGRRDIEVLHQKYLDRRQRGNLKE